MTSNYKLYKSGLVPEINGFSNGGNTCWQNALTQMLLSLSSFNEYILTCGSEINSAYVQLYMKFLEQTLPLDAINEIRAKCGKPALIAERDRISLESASTQLLNAFISDHKKIESNSQYIVGQQDSAIMGFIDLLSAIADEEVYRYFNNKYAIETECSKCKRITSKIEDKSPLLKMYNDLPITTQTSMEKWVMFRMERISGFSCELCGEKDTKALRQETLHMLREVIIINYKLPLASRYFPNELRFPGIGNVVLTYKKVSQVEWSGGFDAPAQGTAALRKNYSYASSGHYWASVLRPTPKTREFKWFNANDSSISAISDVDDKFMAKQPFSNGNSIIVAYHLFSVTPMTEEDKKYFGV